MGGEWAGVGTALGGWYAYTVQRVGIQSPACYNTINKITGKENRAMRHRKTANAAELSEARRRAALSRKNFSGGRPTGWARVAARPPSTIELDPLDAAVLRNYAALRGITLRRVMHLLSAALVLGAEMPKRENLAPDGWAYRCE